MRNKNRDIDKALEEFLDKFFDSQLKAQDMNIRRKHFHITITNNDNGEIIADDDTNCIVGAYDHDNKGTASMGFSHCGIAELCATCEGARRSIDKMTEDNPLARLMLAAAKCED